MNVLIKSATIIDSKSDFHNKTQDILIENGIITKIGSRIANPNNYKTLQLEDLHVSQGWFDSSVCFGEPGYEERETVANGLKTAAKSGFTNVAVNPNTNPVISTSSDVAYLKSKADQHAVNLWPIGALTADGKGEALAELFDMKNAGAVAFGDYKTPIKNANLLKIALLYGANVNSLILSFPNDLSIAGQGVMNEYITSTTMGLKGLPALAEELHVSRDLFLLEYTHGKLHIPTISTAKSVEMIRMAKSKKLDVSCSVAVHNLYDTDEALTSFDTNYKVNPPLRTQADVDALISGIKDGTIDMVTSDHNPLDIELKKMEFDHAESGTIGLESSFAALNTLFSIKATIKLLTKGKSRFGLKEMPIAVGNKAEITLFNPNYKFTFTKENIYSKSANSIFLGKPLQGKVYGIINNNKIVI